MSEPKNFTVISHGRTWSQCKLNDRYNCRVAKDPRLADKPPGYRFSAIVKDVTKRTAYGGTLSFEIIELLTAEDAAERQRQKDAEERRAKRLRELGYLIRDARAHASQGLVRTQKVLTFLQTTFPESLQAEVEELKAYIATRKTEVALAAAEEQSRRQAEKAAAAEANPRILMLASNPYSVGSVVLHRGRHLVVTGHGKWFKVSDDASSMGLAPPGHEGESCRYAYCTAATAAQIAEYEAEQQRAREAMEARAEAVGKLSAIRKSFLEHGQLPPAGQPEPAGDKFLNTVNIYGSGEVFVVGEHSIWHLRKNMMDGDDWSANNIVGGWIGRYQPRTEALVDDLRALEQTGYFVKD